MDVKLSRAGEEWLVYIELVKFVETMLLTGQNALSPEPRRGASRVEQRLPADVEVELREAVSGAPEPGELRPPARFTANGPSDREGPFVAVLLR